jgi:hypothetical protein
MAICAQISAKSRAFCQISATETILFHIKGLTFGEICVTLTMENIKKYPKKQQKKGDFMLKKLIAVTTIAIFLVFGAIGITILGNGTIFADSNGAKADTMKIVYVNGLSGADKKTAEQKVAVYEDETTHKMVTRENATKLLSPEKAKFVRTGYDFDGWRLATDSTILRDFVPAGIAKEDGIAQIFATWQAQSYKLSFDPDYPGLLSPAPIDVTYDEGIVGINGITNVDGVTFDYNLVRGGLYFWGWRTAPNGEGTEVFQTMPSTYVKDEIVYGWWKNEKRHTAPVVTTRTAYISSMVHDTTTAGPLPTYQTTFTNGQTMKMTLSQLDNFNGYTFHAIKINSNDLVLKSNFNQSGEYTYGPINADVTVVVYYKVAGGENPSAETYTATFIGKVASTGAALALTSIGKNPQTGIRATDKIAIELAGLAVSGHTLSYVTVQIGASTTTVQPADFNKTFTTGGVTYENIYYTPVISQNAIITAYYTVNQTPTNPTTQKYTATFAGRVIDTNAVVTLPNIGTNPQTGIVSGGRVAVRLAGLAVSGYTLSYVNVRIGNGTVTRVEVAQFNETYTTGGVTYTQIYFTAQITANTTITAYYTVNNAPATQTVTLKIQSALIGKAIGTGPWDVATYDFTKGKTVSFWSKSFSGAAGFNEYTARNFTLDYYMISGETTKYYPVARVDADGKANAVFEVTWNAGATVTVYYR